ncbi:hypothetical protein CCR75_005888 [Bremia lactucae]|uniref:Uncharacterized protein n=1 Tax=Bremia lactucae TaxID=4779 RepID=A0A976FMX8_BRELC|nr:hypothetical protein CCR75_005888 [Bremia lactucae]
MQDMVNLGVGNLAGIVLQNTENLAVGDIAHLKAHKLAGNHIVKTGTSSLRLNKPLTFQNASSKSRFYKDLKGSLFLHEERQNGSNSRPQVLRKS